MSAHMAAQEMLLSSPGFHSNGDNNREDYALKIVEGRRVQKRICRKDSQTGTPNICVMIVIIF